MQADILRELGPSDLKIVDYDLNSKFPLEPSGIFRDEDNSIII